MLVEISNNMPQFNIWELAAKIIQPMAGLITVLVTIFVIYMALRHFLEVLGIASYFRGMQEHNRIKERARRYERRREDFANYIAMNNELKKSKYGRKYLKITGIED